MGFLRVIEAQSPSQYVYDRMSGWQVKRLEPSLFRGSGLANGLKKTIFVQYVGLNES